MNLLGQACIAAWKARVREELPDNTLKTAYLQQLQVIEVTDTSVTFGLPGGKEKPAVLAYIAENGMEAHDMNEYLTKNGRTSWMFRGRLVQSKQGKVAFVPMEKSHSKIGKQAASEDVSAVIGAIKALRPTKEAFTSDGQRQTLWGERLAKDMGVKLKPSHKYDALRSMVRVVAMYSWSEKANKPNIGDRATLFRTVTEFGKRWQREATPAALIAEKVMTLDVPQLMEKVLGEVSK